MMSAAGHMCVYRERGERRKCPNAMTHSLYKGSWELQRPLRHEIVACVNERKYTAAKIDTNKTLGKEQDCVAYTYLRL